MADKMVQSSLFEEGIDFATEPRTQSAIVNRIVLLSEELRIGDWDYNRLLPELEKYQGTVKRWRGITKFKYPQNKFDAIEARAIVAFLKGWVSRRDNLTAEIAEYEFKLGRFE